MTDQDIINIASSVTRRDWIDYLVIIASLISSLAAMIAVIYAAISTKSAKEATKLNMQMYEEQKVEGEKALQPIFELSNVAIYGDHLKFKLKNINHYPISIKNVEYEDSESAFEYKMAAEEIGCVLLEDIEDQKIFGVTIKYSITDGRNFEREVRLKRDRLRLYIDRQSDWILTT